MPGSSKPPPTGPAVPSNARASTARELYEDHRELVLGWPRGVVGDIPASWQELAERTAARAGLPAPPVEASPPDPAAAPE